VPARTCRQNPTSLTGEFPAAINGVADLPSRKLPGLLAGLNGRKINALL
jgi:hypothetical protein